MDVNVMEEIERIERIIGRLSNTQKILLSTDGSVTRILDVLRGTVTIRTIKQEFIPSTPEIADKLRIPSGEMVNHRVVVIGNNEPLIHAVSYIPLSRLDDGFREDLIRADIPIGRILKKHSIESRREIEILDIESPSRELREIFKTDSPMLTRTYNIIHQDEVLIRIKETFPFDWFREEFR